VTEEIVRQDFPELGDYLRYSGRRRENNQQVLGKALSSPQPVLDRIINMSTDMTPPGSETPSEFLSPEYDYIVRGITDRLMEVGFRPKGRSRSHSSPSPMKPLAIVDRKSTFSTAPTGSSFGCIFTVKMPTIRYNAPLTRLGRPLIANGIPTEKFTVVATFHASYRQFVIDILEHSYLCPVGFDSSQIVDLIYMQKRGYLPEYCIWPAQPNVHKRYQVSSQWSLCTPSADGLDVLYASDLDVLVQRIASSMYRVSETRTMSKNGQTFFLDSISEGGTDFCQAAVFSNLRALEREPMFTNVSMDYTVSAVLDWMPLNANPEKQLPHSREAMPIT
jgi:hypothetical protein